MQEKKKWENRIPLLASFLIPLLIALIVCIDHEVFPFGDRCILHVDMYHQYCPFFTEFMNKLKAGDSLLYSWSIGLGADFVSLYAYYLASPLNWLIVLCPKGYVIEFMTLLVLLKIALCGLTFGYFLKSKYEKNNLWLSVFATAYALSAFMASYAWNIMWTDCLVLAPLIILGLERLIKEGKATLYYVTLAISILANYYISIMICIFLVLYFVILWLENKEKRIRNIFRFGWYSLLAGATGAVLLLPEAIVLGQSGSQGISFPDSIEWYFNIVAELARHSILTAEYTGGDHWPNIYCGCFVLLFVILYILNKEISWKKKLPRLLFVVFFLVSFANNYLDFIWHGLHFPNSLPGRQAFLYSLLLLLICYETVLHLRGNRIWHVAVALVANGAFLSAAYFFSDKELVGALQIGITAIFVVCYAVLVILWLLSKRKLKDWVTYLGILLAIVELTINFDVTGLGTTGRTAYVQDLADYDAVLETIAEKEGEDAFYRIEKFERKTKNDAALSGFYSGTQFSSLMNINVSHFYQKFGLEGGKNFYCHSGATPLISAMLSMKYMIADNDLEANPMRTLVVGSGNTYIYENKYVLPLGFMVSDEVMDAWGTFGSDDIANQNRLAYLLGATEDMFTEIASESKQGESVIEVAEDGYIFATYEKISINSLKEEISDGRTKSFTKTAHGYTLDLGYCHAGDIIKITNEDGVTVNITAYRLNEPSLKQAFETLSEQGMELTEFSDTRVGGTVEVNTPGNLVFSIAKEDGWHVFVDGEEVESKYFGEAFLAVPLSEGTHEILLTYETPGLLIGAGSSTVAIALFVVTIMISKWYQKKKEEVCAPLN